MRRSSPPILGFRSCQKDAKSPKNHENNCGRIIPKLYVAGSIPATRSKNFKQTNYIAGIGAAEETRTKKLRDRRHEIGSPDVRLMDCGAAHTGIAQSSSFRRATWANSRDSRSQAPRRDGRPVRRRDPPARERQRDDSPIRQERPVIKVSKVAFDAPQPNGLCPFDHCRVPRR